MKTLRIIIILAAPALMAPMCEEGPAPPCTKRVHPDDPMDTFLYPDDCREQTGRADGADAGAP